MKRDFDFSQVRRAELTQLEFAALCGVSRVTANMWFTGKMRPHQYIQARVATLLTAIDKALEHELLPLPRPYAKDRKMELVKAALREAATLSSAPGIALSSKSAVTA